MSAINAKLKQQGGVYGTYSCKTVSWDDSSRGQGGFGGLSSVGPNITDTYLQAKNGQPLFTVRSENWNEKLGTVSAASVALITGNHANAELKPLTLRDVLTRAGEHGGYAGLTVGCNLGNDPLDAQCSIRFQTTFLPVEQKFGGRETLEFATEAYNYQTHDDADPKNLVLLCTTQGVAFQADGKAATKIFHHRVDSATGQTRRHWLEAERTTHQVGGSQVESASEKADAVARGKATACVIGPKSIGTRFNVLMTVQVPLEQQLRPVGGGGFSFAAPPPASAAFAAAGAPTYSFGATAAAPTAGGGCGGACFGGGAAAFGGAGAAAPFGGGAAACFGAAGSAPFGAAAFPAYGAPAGGPFGASRPQPATGLANAARVSYGAEHDTWPGLCGRGRTPKRHPSEHITITVVIYNVVAGGVPSDADVVAAIDDLETLYASCKAAARAHVGYANTSMAATPTPAPPPVTDGSVFPTPQLTKPALSFAASAVLPFSDAPPEELQSLPRTRDSFYYVHEIARIRLESAQPTRAGLAEAFALFRLANEIQVQLDGAPAPSALYNMACCCSQMVTAMQKPGAFVPFGAKPGSLESLSVEQCLDASAQWLLASAGAGYTEHAHMMNDTDLNALRTQRHAKFQMAVHVAQALTQLK